MTARSYRDLRASSPNGTLVLEALSPDNGNVLLREGERVPGDDFGCFQKNFRYQLLNADTKTVVWERWQSRAEKSPVHGMVSDEGHVVLQTHSADWGSEDLLFISPQGETRLVIVVAAVGYLDELARRAKPKKRRDKDRPATIVWTDPHVRVSTAGPVWATGAVVTFPTSIAESLFCLRAAWGRRLIVDLRGMILVEESALTASARALVEEAERRHALDTLRGLVDLIQSGATSSWEQRWRGQGAFAVVIDQRISEAASLLRALEPWRLELGTGKSHVDARWEVHHAWMRSLARLALRSIGEEPAPGGNYRFAVRAPSEGSAEADDAAPLQVATPARAWELARHVQPGSTLETVLARIGPPDFIRSTSRKVDEYYVWSEVWEYDGPESSTSVVWSLPESSTREIAQRPRHVSGVEESLRRNDVDRLLALFGLV